MKKGEAGKDLNTDNDDLDAKGVKADTDCEGLDLARLLSYTTDHSPLPMVAVEGQAHIVRQVNPAFCQLAEKAREELIGRPYADVVPEGTENGCLALLDRVYATKQAESLAPASSPFRSFHNIRFD